MAIKFSQVVQYLSLEVISPIGEHDWKFRQFAAVSRFAACTSLRYSYTKLVPAYHQ